MESDKKGKHMDDARFEGMLPNVARLNNASQFLV
jgi:hypothetical protein